MTDDPPDFTPFLCRTCGSFLGCVSHDGRMLWTGYGWAERKDETRCECGRLNVWHPARERDKVGA
jgi:hypothetical protein